MADLRRSIEIIFEGTDNASRKAADVLAQVRALDQQAAAAAVNTDKLSGSLEGIGSRGTPAIAAAASAMVAFAASLAIDKFVDVNVAVEKFELGLKAVKGASADTGAEFAYISGLANKLGLNLLETTQAYVSLTAATKGTALEGQATRDIFEAVTRASSAMGKSTAETDGILRALEQIASKGKVSMEELRQQLGDRLPGAMQIAARAMGVTTGELQDLVKKGISAEEFLPRFAAELNRTFQGASFDGYSQNLNRLKNSIDELLIQAGKSGAFETLTSGVKSATGIVKELDISTGFYADTYRAVVRLIKERDMERFGEDMTGAKRKAEILAAELKAGVNQQLAETAMFARKASEAISEQFKFDQTDAETARLKRQSESLGEAIKAATEFDKLMKNLGVDKKKLTDGFESIARDLEALAKNPKTNGQDFALAFDASLKKATTADGLAALEKALYEAFSQGKISASELDKEVAKLDKAFAGLDGTTAKSKDKTDDYAKSLAKQAEETRKAEEAAKKLEIELEKIASNERIKIIEAKVQLDIASLQAQTKQVEAAFASINETVKSTGDLLGDLFGLFKDEEKLSFRALFQIEKQINLENERRQQALNLQKSLTEAQIEYLRAQSRKLDKGLSLIQVDGSGLQPHLEAFMWEILKAVQVRVNQDGLEMLLGV